MKQHDKLGSVPESIEELEMWMGAAARTGSGGWRACAEHNLELLCAVTGGDTWDIYEAEQDSFDDMFDSSKDRLSQIIRGMHPKDATTERQSS